MTSTSKSLSVSWFAAPRRFWAAVTLCVLIAAALRPFPAQFKFRHGGDCVRYLNWSHTLRDGGLAAMPGLVREYRARWVGFPPPTRWLYLATAALIEKAWTAPGDEYHPLVLVSWLAGVLALLPLAFWLRRIAAPPVVLAALLLVATSPVGRAMSHFPLPDTLGLLLALSLFAFAAAAVRSPGAAALAGLGAAAFCALTTREPNVILIVTTAALVVIEQRRSGVPGGNAWRALAALAAGSVAALVVTVILAGGPAMLVGLARDVTRAALSVNLGYVDGPFYRYLVDLTIVSPLVVLTAIGTAWWLWQEPEQRALVLNAGATTLVVYCLFSLLPKDLRYMLPADAGLRALCAAAALALPRRIGVPLLAACVATDLWVYHRLWGDDQIYTPVTGLIARQLRMIP